ncbi:MAG: DUF3043 domain-containing protein [Propionibacteriales bacterium]|nr:DUF3043 domain-containing protein [Propionibacteriales bacterium]
MDGKGRPTPKRKEAEAERKKRMTPPRNRKEAAALQKERTRSRRQMARQAMASGDERYLPNRDKGPVRRYVRDFIDVRRSAAEFLLPVLLMILMLSFLGTAWAANMVVTMWMLMIVVTTIDSVLVMWRLGRELNRRFPEGGTRGAKLYGLLRSTQLRRLRMPKPQVKVGQPLPDVYH